MKVSYIVPEGQYTFFAELVEPLRARGIEVYANGWDGDTDLLLAAILPITHEWIGRIKMSGVPYILWHWDLFSFTDYSEPRWKQFLEMMPGATAIWSCSHETARQLKEVKGLESEVATAWVSWTKYVGRNTEPYCLYAASGCGFGKRIDWAERACKLLGVKLEVLRGQSLPRDQYLSKLANCRVYVMPAFEESNGTIPAMEAAALGVPIVCADIPSNREVFGRDGDGDVRYFPPNDFGRFKQAVWEAWHADPDESWAGLQAMQARMAKLFSLDVAADRIAELLERAYARVQKRNR